MENLIADFKNFFIQSNALPEGDNEYVENPEIVPQPEMTVVPKQEVIEADQDNMEKVDLPVVDLEFKAELESVSATSGTF